MSHLGRPAVNQPRGLDTLEPAELNGSGWSPSVTQRPKRKARRIYGDSTQA